MKKTPLRFYVEKAQEKFGDRFEYSIVHENKQTRVKIVCILHGEIETHIHDHVRQKYGCYRCAVEDIAKRRFEKTREKYFQEFLKKAKEKFGDRFDYSSVTSPPDQRETIPIVCPKHWKFWQKMYGHLNSKYGCAQCAKDDASERHLLKERESSEKSFLEKAREKFGDRFDFSLVDYQGNRKPVQIICKEHGPFQMPPSEFLFKTYGCIQCYISQRKQKEEIKEKTQQFIQKSKKKFGDRFDYSKAKYITANENILIICKNHGDQWVRPYNHLESEQGCFQCAMESLKGKPKKAWTTEEFIKTSKEKFGDIFDYSKTKYIDFSTHLTIICPTHGAFSQSPKSHFSGKYGCPRCGMKSIKVRKEKFIQKGIKKFKNQFDYSSFQYAGTRTKGTLICREHGAFSISPHDHLRDRSGGCSACYHNENVKMWKKEGEKRRMTKEEFIAKANQMHKNFYDYSKVEFFHRGSQKVTIICPKHGPFQQIIESHLQGSEGCKGCYSEKKIYPWEAFLEDCRKIHGEKYTYFEKDYVGISKKHKILCPQHGIFFQNLEKHLAGAGCPLCSKEEYRLKRQENFIRRVKEIHGEKTYGYELVEYHGRAEKVKIVCPVHEVFESTPANHLIGSGCPICSSELRKKGYK